MKPPGLLLTLAIAAFVSACATTPAPPPISDATAYEQKVSWILRLEDQRILRETPPPADPAQPPRSPAAAAPPDLTRLIVDRDARIRRRAALAVGRVGLPEGVGPLVPLLGDVEHEVRSMAAFALGLIGDAAAVEPLVNALRDESLLVQGSAAEALGLIGDPAGAAPLSALASRLLAEGALTPLPGDELDGDRATAAGVFRLAVYALVRMQAYDALASAVLDEGGRPRTTWWPVAYALQRVEDPRAQPALRELASAPHVHTRTFAIKGLGSTRDRSAVPQLIPLLTGPERPVAIEAVRALGKIGDPAGTAGLIELLTRRGIDPHVRAEAAAALALVRGEGSTDVLIDLLSDVSPLVRASALRGLAASDPQGFVFILSGLDPDAHWSVRAELAAVLGTLPSEAALPRLRAMLDDPDARVLPAVLAALTALKAPGLQTIAALHLRHEDPVVRAAAARSLAAQKATSSLEMLGEAYRAARRDLSYVARAAALAAGAEVGGRAAVPLLTEALADDDWAVRLRAAALLRGIDPTTDASSRIRPAPTQWPLERYATPHIVDPPVSTQLFIETDRGTIQIELAVLDAPLTVEHIVTLARRGFFNGLAFHRVVPGFVIQGGDPRGDGEGGPGFTIRDELNERAYVRGTVGMALDGEDTGGSQFFITPSPQPHLDARYTVIGRVISGMDVVDQIQPWDVMTRVRVWDGQIYSE